MEEVEKALVTAVKENDLEKVKFLLNNNANPNCLGEEHICGKSIFHTATSKAQKDIVIELLKHGADPNFPDYQDNTPFFLVTMRDDAQELINIFLEYGADIDRMNILYQTPLCNIIKQKLMSNEDLQLLISKVGNTKQKSNTGGNLLHMVVDTHPFEIEDGFDENEHFCGIYLETLYKNHTSQFQLWLNEYDEDGDTPLQVISSASCLESIKFFLKVGAAVNVKDYEGLTPLHYLAASADFKGFRESLECLIHAGAFIDEKDNSGKTPLHYALSTGDSNDPGVIENLIEKGAKISTTDVFNRNLCHSVVEHGKDDEFILQCINLLHEHGVDINGKDMFGLTPLHLVVSRKRKCTEVIDKLLSLGAQATAESRTGDTPLHRSCVRYANGPSLIDWFSNRGMEINHKDSFGSTPLHWAIWVREQVVIKHLLKNGADKNIPDKNGNTPSALARLLHYEQYDYLIGNSIPESNICMTLDDFEIEYHGTDIFEECPYLCYIDKTNRKIDVDHWKRHLELHKQPLTKFVSTTLTTGDYFDLPENRIIDNTIDKVMKELAGYVSGRDRVLSCEVRLAGSKNETTKVGPPNEYDYVWSLSEFQNKLVPETSNSTAIDIIRLKAKEDAKSFLQQYLDKDGYLESTKTNRALYSIINEGLIKIFSDKSRDELDSLYISELLDTKGNLSCVTFTWVGPVMKLLNISVDIVPEIAVENWFPGAINTRSVLFNKMEGSNKNRVPVVMKTPDKNFVFDWARYFRLSFASWEQEIIKRYPRAVLKGFILIKAFIQSHYFPTIIDSDNEGVDFEFITTYRIKTCFLHELEEAEKVGDDSLKTSADLTSIRISIDWANRILNRLQRSVDQMSLPSFFCPERNLLLFEGSRVMYSLEEYHALCACLRELLEQGNPLE